MNTLLEKRKAEKRESGNDMAAGASPELTREQMIECLWRGFGNDGHNPEGFSEYLHSRSNEQLGEMVAMLNATAVNGETRPHPQGEGVSPAPDFADLVATELSRARDLHGKITGAHDGYARILEEVDELWDEVKRKERNRSKDAMCSELVQISAICQRMAEDLKLIYANHS
jgi:hypothetical protein